MLAMSQFYLSYVVALHPGNDSTFAHQVKYFLFDINCITINLNIMGRYKNIKYLFNLIPEKLFLIHRHFIYFRFIKPNKFEIQFANI